MADKTLYKVVFLNNGKVYELFANNVVSSGLWGFVEVSGLVFETSDGLVVDPWGNRFRVMIDSDFDGAIPAPDGTVMQTAVLVWSLGPNGKDEGGAGDDLATWH